MQLAVSCRTTIEPYLVRKPKAQTIKRAALYRVLTAGAFTSGSHRTSDTGFLSRPYLLKFNSAVMWSRALATVFIIYCLNTGFCEVSELLDLSCTSDSDCEYFRRTGQNVTCSVEKCVCESIDNQQPVDCEPTDLRQNNIIGGHCPCRMENAFCDSTNKVCLCNTEFIASYDKRRCIRKSVPLGELCEDNSQCLSSNHFTVCDPNKKACVCLEQFVEKNSQCLSIVALIETCAHDIQCENHTKNSICSDEKCFCKPGFVANILKTTCLPNSGYMETCVEANQCKSKLGSGGICDGGVCTCSSEYFVLNASINRTQLKRCQKKPALGDYCRDSSDCSYINLENAVVECFSGYCRCIPVEGNNCPSGVDKSYSVMFGHLFVVPAICLYFIFPFL